MSCVAREGSCCGWKNILQFCNRLRWLCLWHSWSLGRGLGRSFIFCSLAWFGEDLLTAPPAPCCKYVRKGFCCPVNWKLPVLHEQLRAVRFPVNLTEGGLCTPTLGVNVLLVMARNWNWIYIKAKTLLSCNCCTCGKLSPFWSVMLTPK